LESRLVPSTFAEFPVPGAPEAPLQLPNQVVGAHITTGPDGNVWFTHNADRAVGRIAPDGSVTEFPLASDIDAQYSITAGPDGNLWLGTGHFSPTFPNDQIFILRMTPDGNQTYFRARPDDISPNDFFATFYGPTAGPDGGLWYHAGFYTSPNEDLVGRITPDGTVTNFIIPQFDGFFSAGGITPGPGGDLWLRIGDGVSRITPDGQLLGPVAGSHALGEMTTGPDGSAWGVWPGSVLDHRAGEVERITPDGSVTDFPLPTQTRALGITAGPDGNVWFTEPAANQIGVITPDGQITEYQVPTPNSQPAGITTGPDGNIWFTELGSSQIGEFVLNDGGGPGGAAAPARAARRDAGDLPASVAGVDAAFAAARPQALSPAGVVGRPPAAAAVDAASAVTRVEAVTPPKAQAVVEAGAVHHHRGERAEAADAAGLADPLAAGLAQVV
jgi:virginiamycin B lyase